jgi:uncharacterized protein YbaR (Trm112 family)
MMDQETQSAGKDSATAEPVLDPAFVALLCCPVCAERPPLRLTEDGGQQLLCDRCGTVYPIVAEYGFPDLRPPAADPPRETSKEARPA